MASQPNQALPHGCQLLNYRIDKQISSGGFSLVYLAHDENGLPVAIKEYLPSALVLRESGSLVQASSAENLNVFRYGMKCFFEEGLALARITHPNVVRVTNFFRANETVYLVMQYERGRTLQDYILYHKKEIKENFIRRIFAEMLGGLREVHAHKILHLDIKPSNIYIRLDGSPLLLDFGAARQTLTQEKSSLTPMYTPGFAAPEQYGHDRDALGPWTDIYGVGASLFACLAGFAPQAANQRLEQDKQESAKKLWGGHYSEHFLELIDWCLKLDPLERPQSVFVVQKALLEKDKVPEAQKKTSLLHSLRNKFSKTKTGDR
ncbi:MAG: serine/threonine protein kinase [Betaproteobacteria bacterium CG2_30_59_46]|nr:MAG: serine/threonine protein kinase [Betaproteobacteria bacterium CG2_30_59_46]PIQ12902.1 MAG: serine/threonine protein kinase [Hydrogenophilales bacterium CG18_big_fil_WC_8_21_14_2_50_58_12]PIY02028.1 MAG: serine/threonine protein kinase [Hydrogenophilales bacterium CG_4_10_14_3_um_filter_58_23]PJB06665.1 MAG: serine/threonine protein kinase [Hydrogenophilales bacterium CG_4_9_14_3_um_filter_59_35]